jgi:glycosyltransferase involved in cell wall biosynthesis
MGKDNPLVSIIVATYNGEKYIEEQILSLVHQTYKHIEIIVTDDCSKDATVDVVRRLAGQYNNIKLYQNEHNLGYQKNFEKGLRLAKGEYIALCDQDDVWAIEKIQILLECIGYHTLVYSNSRLVDSDGKDLGKTMKEHLGMNKFISGKNPYFFMVKNCVSGHAMMFRSNLIESIVPFPDSIIYDQWIALIASVKTGIAFVDKPLVNHRLHETNAVINEKLRSERRRILKVQLKTNKVRRYRQRVETRKAKLEALDRLRNTSKGADSEFLEDILFYCQRLRQSESRFVDIAFFLFLVKRRHDFYPSKSAYKAIKQCFNESKGKYWHMIFDLGRYGR